MFLLKSARKAPELSRIKIIRPQHPTLILSELNTNNILPYSRRSNTILVTPATEAPRSFREAQDSVNKSKWAYAISEKLLEMEIQQVWDIIDIDLK
ncbi:hypothetical protein O181_011974 [Austropuccinia psidii MF-1]|uniref:Uncharacterized protein n=1 Tax=Austropuccinia psidii MF-1 TaxID=1389203 RepID=A0A9Q3BTT1_9BASI|nr:hypothetical protein [Austropuccinia psidii MF-1]